MIGLRATVNTAELDRRLDERSRQIGRVATEATRAAAYSLRNKLRRALAAAVDLGSHGLPRHLDQAIVVRGPRGEGDPRAQVVSIATVQRGGGVVDLIEVLAHGATVQAPTGHLLAIPTENAPRIGRRVMTASEAIDALGDAMVFIPTRGGGIFVERAKVADRGLVLYVCEPAERVAARFDLDGLVAGAGADLRARLEAGLKG